MARGPARRALLRVVSAIPGDDGGMSPFTEHPRARWAVPAAAVAAVGAVSLVTSYTASADASLPPRTAAQLLVDVQRAQLGYLSGTVVQSAELGLPDLSALGGPGGRGSASLESVVSGTHTWRVWYGGQEQQRLALVGQLGESDIIRNGRDLWVWSSQEKTAVHSTLPVRDAAQKAPNPAPTVTDLPKTPEEAARRALAALDPSTRVSTSGTAKVAGRDAYELVLEPRDSASLVQSVRISVDAEKHLPLRVQVYSTKAANPAFEVGFTSIDFDRPDARQFEFNPPPGTTVTEKDLPAGGHGKDGPADAARPRVVGSGWGAVVVATVPPSALGSGSGDGGQQLQSLLQALPRVSGAWGSGRLLSGTLFSAVLTDDGRVAVGAVAPQSLYAALAAR
jgi:outer membrane lipoprotein-sorting protein